MPSMNRSSEMRLDTPFPSSSGANLDWLKQGGANITDCSECELTSDRASTMASYARLVKRTAEEYQVPFRTLATDTKPRRHLVAATECLLHVSIRRSSNSSLARVKYPRLDPLEVCMGASSQGRFCIRSRPGYQRQHSCLPRPSASSGYAS